MVASKPKFVTESRGCAISPSFLIPLPALSAVTVDTSVKSLSIQGGLARSSIG
jgi:hypothetical protein